MSLLKHISDPPRDKASGNAQLSALKDTETVEVTAITIDLNRPQK